MAMAMAMLMISGFVQVYRSACNLVILYCWPYIRTREPKEDGNDETEVKKTRLLFTVLGCWCADGWRQERRRGGRRFIMYELKATE